MSLRSPKAHTHTHSLGSLHLAKDASSLCFMACHTFIRRVMEVWPSDPDAPSLSLAFPLSSLHHSVFLYVGLRVWSVVSVVHSQIYCIENAHGQLVRDLDFNPNKQYYLSSCGDDCKVKFWDVRHINEPVKSLEEHSHWLDSQKHTQTQGWKSTLNTSQKFGIIKN